MTPFFGKLVPALYTGYDANRALHNRDLKTTSDVALDLLSFARGKKPPRFDLYKTTSEIDRFLHKTGRKVK